MKNTATIPIPATILSTNSGGIPMAERRMFAKTIIDSDAFLEMPATAQMLYFHLAMRADDDGFINNPKRIMRMIGSGDDDLKLLILKKFIIPFESGVVVIKHWRINNYLRTDRYKETAYIDEKSRLEIKENGAYTLIESGMDTAGIPNGYQCETQDRIGKDRIGKVSIEVSNDTLSPCGDPHAPLDYKSIVATFNSTCHSLPKVRNITEQRKKAIKRTAKQVEDAGGFSALFEKVESSDFLSGRNGGWNGCGFDWILKPANLTKILEGNYDNRAGASPPDYTDPDRYKNTGWGEYI
jgi:hypothetical protein